MNTQFRILLFFLILLHLASCNERVVIDYNFKSELSRECKLIANKRTILHNTEYSNYYYISKRIGIKATQNNFMDSVVLLSPISLSLSNAKCFNDNNDVPIILVFQKVGNGSMKLLNIFDNVMLGRDPKVLFQDIDTSDNNSFKVIGDFGHARKVYYQLFVNYRSGDFWLDSMKLEEFGQKHMRIDTTWDNYKLKNFDKKFIDLIL